MKKWMSYIICAIAAMAVISGCSDSGGGEKIKFTEGLVKEKTVYIALEDDDASRGKTTMDQTSDYLRAHFAADGYLDTQLSEDVFGPSLDKSTETEIADTWRVENGKLIVLYGGEEHTYTLVKADSVKWIVKADDETENEYWFLQQKFRQSDLAGKSFYSYDQSMIYRFGQDGTFYLDYDLSGGATCSYEIKEDGSSLTITACKEGSETPSTSLHTVYLAQRFDLDGDHYLAVWHDMLEEGDTDDYIYTKGADFWREEESGY